MGPADHRQPSDGVPAAGGRPSRSRRQCAGAPGCTAVGTTFWHDASGRRFTAASAPNDGTLLYCDAHAPAREACDV